MIDASKVKKLINTSVDSPADDELIILLIEIVQQGIMNYCNLTEFPPELEGTLLLIVAEFYNDTMNKPSPEMANVSSISEGGRTVSFSSSSIQYGFQIDDALAKRYQLNKFKRLYKIIE